MNSEYVLSWRIHPLRDTAPDSRFYFQRLRPILASGECYWNGVNLRRASRFYQIQGRRYVIPQFPCEEIMGVHFRTHIQKNNMVFIMPLVQALKRIIYMFSYTLYLCLGYLYQFSFPFPSAFSLEVASRHCHFHFHSFIIFFVF